MKYLSTFCIALIALMAVGCAVAPTPFQPIDLGQDLSAATLARYESEMADAHSSGAMSGGGEHGGHMTMTLEGTDWWPLGLLAYWRKGAVQAMHSPDGGPYYMVSQVDGYGPLALLWVSKKQAVYGPNGKRLSYMGMGSAGWGHVAMTHAMGTTLDGGPWMEHDSIAIFHHMLNIGQGHGKTSVSIGSSPNPMGIRQ
jgi:hypothetical protein